MNSYPKLVAATVLLCMSASISAVPVTSGLRAQFDAGQGALNWSDVAAADGEKIKTWSDQAGTADNAISPNINHSPILVANNANFNNQPTVRFGVTSTHTGFAPLNAGTGLNIIGDGLTLFAALQFSSTTSEQGIVGNYASSQGYFLAENSTGDDRFKFFAGGATRTGSTGNPFAKSTVAVARPRILTAVKDVGTSQLLINRLLLSSGSSGSIGLSTSTHEFLIGFAPGHTAIFRGDFAEILVYDRVLSASEQAEVTYYLEQKYGIPEPASATLLIFGAALVLTRRRRGA